MKKILFVSLLLLCYAIIKAQPDKEEKELSKTYFAEGETLLDEGRFDKAIKLWSYLVKEQPDNGNFNYKLALCYLNSVLEREKAITYFERALTKVSDKCNTESYDEKNAPLETYYYLGDAYRRNYRFQDAIDILNKLKSEYNLQDPLFLKKINRQIEMSRNGLELIQTPVKMNIVNLGCVVNSESKEHSPVISADESTMIFTSRREGTTGGKIASDGDYYEDIYISFSKEGTWTAPVSIGENINTAENEATIGLSVDGQQLFIYRDDKGDGNIYISQLEGYVWSKPQKLGPPINTKYNETHASLSSDGLTLFFSSDRPGGFGGKDIYMCKKLPNGTWGEAKNLGPIINTEYNEEGPFLHPDGVTLFFSSEGHKTMGGYDIFYSTVDEEGSWSVPENIGYPINTPEHDVFYMPTPDGKRAYYATYDPKGCGETDICIISLPERESSDLTVMTGIVTTPNGKPAKNVLITVSDAITGEVYGIYTPNVSTGKYLYILRAGKKYNIQFETSDGEMVFNETMDVPEGKAYEQIQRAIELQPKVIPNKPKPEPVIPKEEPLPVQQPTVAKLISIKGTIKDAVTLEPVSAQIEISDNATGKIVSSFASNKTDGSYISNLTSGKDYGFTVKADDYLFFSDNIDIRKEPEENEIIKNVLLNKPEVSKSMVLKNIFFDFNKATLRPQSFTELNNLVEMLSKNYPTMRIKISGHTDNVGSEKYNIKLSRDRAKAVVMYLKNHGINIDRLEYEGYGFSKPIAPNDTEQGRQLNRRVEFEILSK